MIRLLPRVRRRRSPLNWSPRHGVFITREPRRGMRLIAWDKRLGGLVGARLARHVLTLALSMLGLAAVFFVFGFLAKLAEAMR